MISQVIIGQIGLRPAQQMVESRAIIVSQCEEHRIGLPF